MSADFSIMQQYTPTEHTGKLIVKTTPAAQNNDGWDWPPHNVYLQCRDGTVDWVADFFTREAADAYVVQAEAEITLSRGRV